LFGLRSFNAFFLVASPCGGLSQLTNHPMVAAEHNTMPQTTKGGLYQ